MQYTSIILAFFLPGIALAQHKYTDPPFYKKDSVFISGKVNDQYGTPLPNVLVLYTPFYIQKFDVVWKETDTTYTDENGRFVVASNGHQLFDQSLYFKKDSFQLSRHYIQNLSHNTVIDTPVVMYHRKQNWYDSKTISADDVGMTVGSAIKKFKINLNYTRIFTVPNAPNLIRGIRGEMPDSSMILLLIEEYISNEYSKKTIFERKITGIGIAFPNGDKGKIGNFPFDDRKIYNEYYREKIKLSER